MSNLIILIGCFNSPGRLEYDNFDHENPPFIDKLFSSYKKILIDPEYPESSNVKNVEIINRDFFEIIDYLIEKINNTSDFVIIHQYLGANSIIFDNIIKNQNLKKSQEQILVDYSLFKVGECIIKSEDFNNIPVIENNKFSVTSFNDPFYPTVCEFINFYKKIQDNINLLRFLFYYAKQIVYQIPIEKELSDDHRQFLNIVIQVSNKFLIECNFDLNNYNSDSRGKVFNILVKIRNHINI